MKVTEVSHPLVQHKLTLMRDKNTEPYIFRNLLKEISILLGYEATKNLPMKTQNIVTPVAPMNAPVLAEKEPILVSILRAGNGILDGMMELMPTTSVGFIGLFRRPEDLAIVEYYYKMPGDIDKRHVMLVDPMLATGHSAVVAINRLKENNPLSIKFVCALAAPEGIEYLQAHHPEVEIFTASIDEKLNEKKYIVPGLGDAGDRIFGTVH